MCVCVYLEQEVHEAAVGLHLVFQLVEDDEGGERKAGALCMKQSKKSEIVKICLNEQFRVLIMNRWNYIF